MSHDSPPVSADPTARDAAPASPLPARPLRIGVVAPEFPPQLGGVQTYAWEICAELARRGHDVTVLAPPHKDADDDAKAPFRIERILRERERHDARAVRERPRDVWHGMNAACAWLCRAAPCSVVSVHGNDFLDPYTLFGRPDLRARWRLPFGSRLDHWLGRRLTARAMRRDLPRVSCLLANSRYTRERFASLHPGCRDRIEVVPPAVSGWFLEPPLPVARRPGPLRFTTVTRLEEPQKNVDRVLGALARLAKEQPGLDWRYTVVGNGPLRAELESLGNSLGLGDRVSFTGRVGGDALRAILMETDLFVMTPRATAGSFEGFGIVFLEAAACGAPSLGSRCGGIAEAIKQGVNGFIVEEPETSVIASALANFALDRMRFDREACRRHAAASTWPGAVDRIESIYHSLTGITVS